MPTFAKTISDKNAEFIKNQHMFFIGTAPLGAEGHVNLSPKGLDTFLVLDESTVAYLDLTGSGIETIAHIRENGRVTIMFCAFDGAPNIVRLYGQGEVLNEDHEEFSTLRDRLPSFEGVRGIIRVHVDRVSNSCGFSVPLYDFVDERQQLVKYMEGLKPEGIQEFIKKWNETSIDGLPGIDDKKV